MPQRNIVLSNFASSLWAGSSAGALPGSGKSSPKGLEHYFEYNGFRFHDRSVVDKYRVTKISGLRDADIRDGQREGKTDDHGEDYGSSYYGGRSITFEGIIVAHNFGKLRDMEQGLRTAFAGLVEKPLILRTGNEKYDVQIFCKKVEKLGGEEVQSSMKPEREFQILLRASNPRILSLLTERYSVPLAANFSGEVVRPVNEGNFDAQPVIKVFNCPSVLTITNQTPILNEARSRSLTLYGGSGVPSPITIDPANNEVRDDNGNNLYSLLAPSSDDILIASGENQITAVASGNGPNGSGAFQIDIEFCHSWI